MMMDTKPLLLLTTLLVLVAPTGSAMLAEQWKDVAKNPPGARVDWGGSEAAGTPMGTARFLLSGHQISVESDEGCVSSWSAGADAPKYFAFKIPETVNGHKVKGARITTELSPGPAPCLTFYHQGVVVHRGFVGEWSTPGSFPPGSYGMRMNSPGWFRATVEVDLVAVS